MKVLFLCQRVPYPPDRGDRITTNHVLRHLLASGARVRVGCLAEERRDEESAQQLASRVAAICAPRLPALAKLHSFRGLVSGEPLSLAYFRHPDLVGTVRGWLQQDPPDLIYVYSSAMAQYALHHRGAVRAMQFAELDSDKWLQYARHSGPLTSWIYAREARLLLDFERRVAHAFDVSFVVSPAEKELFNLHIPDVEPVILPNGVDVDAFRSAGDDHRDPHTVIFTGVMDYRPNVDGVLWFTEHCWPAIRQRFPDARFLVVGSRPTAAITALDGDDGVEVTGRVPETPPWFDRAGLAVAPLRLARGVQNKVLEAMSMGLPVVASPAAAGGVVGHGEELIVAETASDTVAAVCGLMGDPHRARRLGEQAAAFVREHYRWEDMLAILDRQLDRLLGGTDPVQMRR